MSIAPSSSPELDVVARLEALGREVARGADLLEHHVVVLAADRHAGLDEVRQLVRATASSCSWACEAASRRP